ncbi:MAG: Peptidase family U32 [Firmicutes bacterium ADurb.Bin456]|nr:MAG: Peptidase family U32 [Firmicutes bacterium ADurb.Bin456]
MQLELPGRVYPGDRVFKTHDADLMNRAVASFKSPGGQQKIPLVFTIEGRLGEPLKIRVEDAAGHHGEALTVSPVQKAHKRPLTPAYLEQQLGRLGNTPYGLARLQCRLEGELMAPVSEINEARRQAIAGLEENRKAAFRRPPLPEDIFERRLTEALFWPAGNKDIRPGVPELSVVVGDLPSLKAAVKAGAGEVCLSGEQFRSRPPVSLEEILAGGEACSRAGVRFVLGSPRILQDRELTGFCRLLEKARAGHLDGIMAGNLGLVKIAREFTGVPVFGDFYLNVFNPETARFLREAGVGRVALSPELTLEQIKRMANLLPLPAEVIVHGALPLMVSEYCVMGSLLGENGRREGCPAPCLDTGCSLKDRKGVVFPVEMDQNCRMHIFNSRDLCFIDDIQELARAGIPVLRIEARREGAGYVRDVTRAYRAALTQRPGEGREESLTVLKENLIRYSPAGFTKGHFYRGVL